MTTFVPALNSAMQSLYANQLGLSVASKNISNAQTPGYSRERLILAPSSPDGVDVIGIEALRDKLATHRFNQETSYKSAQDTLQQGLQDIQGSFNDTQGTGLLSYVTGFFNSFQALSVDPTSMANREAVKQAAQSLINAFHSQASGLNNQQRTADQAIATDVDSINSLTSQIASLTKQIQLAETPGSPPQNELRDQRTQLVQKLSQAVEVHQIESDGTYQLYVASGRTVVLNGDSQNLTTGLDTNGLHRVKAGNYDITSEIAGGDLQGQLQLRDQNIPAYLNQLDQLANAVTQQVNTIHSAAYSLDGNTGINFFAPLGTASGAARAIALSSDVATSTRNIAASQNSTAAGDNAAAIAIGNLLHAPVFSGGGSVTDQYGALVFNIGNDAANAKAGFQEHDALATQLHNRMQSTSGVSVDEETVQILQFQRAFQASAKVISTVDQLLQTALAMVRT
ncbi:MAG TPA: flagellar hook-associated protein FlgK [Terriglobia bacterium]|nr:flagellar hook-associated protein FlgK [Terriglobia bacterium]